ncbi:MAG: hypothetical protein WAU39_01790 [Polyangiales bacterium]
MKPPLADVYGDASVAVNERTGASVMSMMTRSRWLQVVYECSHLTGIPGESGKLAPA